MIKKTFPFAKFLVVLFIFISFLFLGRIANLDLNSIARILGLTTTNQSVKIIFGGDLMFDRYIRQKAQKHGNDYIFGDMKDILVESDLVVVNLEGSVTTFPSISIYSEFGSSENYVFTFDPNLVETLKVHNIRLVNIGNNHISNFGLNGLNQTKNYLGQENIKYFGDTGHQDDQKFIIDEIKGLKIAFVNYNQFVKNGKPTTLENIVLLREQVDFVVVYAHWGTEYMTQANASIQKTAREFIDQGADLIVGSHPHVVQQSEVYKGKTIYYSLGNFIFDQYFSNQTMKGLLLEVNINQRDFKATYQEISIVLQPNGQTQVGRVREFVRNFF